MTTNYHPDPARESVHELTTAKFREMETFIESLVGPSRERSMAITKVQEGRMWANAAVAAAFTAAAELADSPQGTVVGAS